MDSLNVDNIDGGEGSGNFGHKGIKGQQGGSAKQGGSPKKSSSSSESKSQKNETTNSKKTNESSSKPSISGGEKEGNVSNGKAIDKENASGGNSVSPSFVKSSKVLNFKRKGSKMDVTEDVVFSPVAKLVKGSEITKIVDFAGGKSDKPVKVEKFLIDKYGGDKGSWTHTRGQAEVMDKEGNAKTVEIHWFESQGVGQVNMKIKRALKINKNAENNSEAKKSKQKGNE